MRSFVKGTFVLLCVLVFLGALLMAQSKENGAIEGKVLSNEGQPLPGVEVVLSSPNMIGGNRSAVTNDEGRFRFPALLPGFYTVEAKLEGFNIQKKEGIKVSVGTTLTVDFAMTLGQINETVTVRGVLPMVDVKDSATAVSNLSNEFILNIPNTQFVAGVVNLAPGISQDSAFGASTTGIQYQIDGVDVSDPELHTAYVFIDYGAVEEVKVSGVGAAAEYDGFTGAVFNTVTKSGGNKIEGMVDSYIQPTSWNSKNSEEITPAKEGYYNIHFNLGGAIKKDTLWYMASMQYERRDRINSGFPENSIYHQPRVMFKLTWQFNKDNRLAATVHGDLYNGSYRGGNANTDPDATRNQRSPEFYFNLNHVLTLSDRLFLESKAAGFSSYYKLIPRMGYDISGHYDIATKRNSVNAGWVYHAYRDRYQLNSALSLYTDKLLTGTHDFKFGIDTELNPIKTDDGRTAGALYTDNNGENYERELQEIKSFKATNFRFSAFAQDSWSVTDKLKINPGIRINYYSGAIRGMGTVFTPEIGIAPRIGITYDLLNDHSTVLKAHYGKFYENIITSFYTFAAPTPDFSYQTWDGSNWHNEYTLSFANRYQFADSIRMPYMNQFTVSIEREIMKDLSASLSYIFRDNKDFIDAVATNAEFSEVPYTDSETGATYTLYNHTNIENTTYVVTNPKKGDYPIVTFTPTRKYSGIQLLLNKRFSNRWMAQVSYSYGKAKGDNDNDPWGGYSSSLGFSPYFQDRNAQINAYGRLTIDPTHMVKIQGTVVLPWDIYLSGNFSYITGNTYDRFLYVDGEEYGLTQGSQYIRSGSRGSYEMPAQTKLDVRLEKQVKIGKTRLGVTFDIYNLFNDGTVNGVYTDAGEYFGEAWSVVNPRAFRAGLRVYLNQ